MSLLPIHPQPKEGEILSSWMVRLSLSNHFPLHTFYSKLLGYKKQIWTRDVDRNPAKDLLELLSDCSGCDLTRIECMTLRLYEGLLYENVRLNGVARWILPIGVFHRTRRRRGMQFCPLCLQENLPFFCLKWRISIFTICEVHGCYLIDGCPQCGEAIEYHRLGINRGDYLPNTQLSKCPKCAFDLSLTQPNYPPSLPELVLSDYQKLLLMVSNNTWNSSLPLPTYYPLSFFDGFKAMLRLVNKRPAFGLREKINEQFPVGLVEKFSDVIEFGYLDIQQRFKLVVASLWLLHDWPGRLVSILREVRQSRSRFAENPDELSFWLSHPLNEFLDQRIYVPTKDEVVAARRYLAVAGEVVSTRSVAKLLGVGVDCLRSLETQFRELS